MNIPATDLKHALKKLSPVKTETYRFDVDGICAQDSDVLVSVDGPSFGGTFNISGKKLTQVVNRMSGEINIEQSGNKLTLKSAKAKVELEVQPVKSVTLPDVAKKGVLFSLPELKKALSTACASASPARSAPFGGCVQIQSLPLGIEDPLPLGYRIVGTDSIVLTVVQVLKPVDFEFKWLLNLTAAAAVQLMDGDSVEIGETNKYLVLRSKDTLVYASKPVQKYPDFDKFLSFPALVKFGLNPAELSSAIRTVEPLIDESIDNGAVTLLFKDGVLQCSCGGIGSTASDEASYEQLEPDPLFDPREVSFKITARYLSGFLSKASESVSLSLTEYPVKMEADGMVVFAMPLREAKK